MHREIEVLRDGYASFSAGDIMRALDVLDPDVEYVLPDDFPEGIGGRFNGRNEVRRLWQSILTELDYWINEPETFVPVPPDRVLVLARTRAKGKASGAEIAMQTADLWTLRDARVVRGVIYRDRAEALRSVGIEPPEASGRTAQHRRSG